MNAFAAISFWNGTEPTDPDAGAHLVSVEDVGDDEPLASRVDGVGHRFFPSAAPTEAAQDAIARRPADRISSRSSFGRRSSAPTCSAT